MKRLLLGLVITAAFTSQLNAQDTDREEMLRQAKVNFGRVLQDPLGFFRGGISENSLYVNSNADKEIAFISSNQFLYAIPIDKWGINITPRVIVPIVYFPPLTDIPLFPPKEGFASETGISDVIVQTFISPQGQEKVKWGIGGQISLKTHNKDYLESAGWGGGFGGVVVIPANQWNFTIVASQLWGFQNGFSSALLRPFVSYNFKNIPGFSLSTSPKFVYDWQRKAWSIPVGGGVSQAIPFSAHSAMVLGLSYYSLNQSTEFSPAGTFNVTVALMFSN